MFLIQTLEYLIKCLNERIAVHLEELGIKVGENPEKALVEHLKMLSAEKPTPDFNPLFSAFAELSLQEKNLDQTLLKFNITWQQLMEQNKASFVSSLHNALKDEKTTLNKLLVLNRFKRQLKALAVNALGELRRREQVLRDARVAEQEAQVAPQQENKAKGKKAAQAVQALEAPDAGELADAQSVDEWICKSVQVSAKEAQELLKEVLENSKRVVRLPLVGFEFEATIDKVGRSEMTVMACELTVLNFYETCKAIDNSRRTPKNDAGLMVDLLPGLWKQDKTLTALNGILANDLIRRLFVEAEFKAYPACGLSEPRRLGSFPAVSSEQARKIICEKARNLHERMLGKMEDDARVWQGLFEEVHDLDTQLLPYENATPLLYARTKPQNPPEPICEGLHKMIEQKGRAVAKEAVDGHKGQCSKLRTH